MAADNPAREVAELHDMQRRAALDRASRYAGRPAGVAVMTERTVPRPRPQSRSRGRQDTIRRPRRHIGVPVAAGTWAAGRAGAVVAFALAQVGKPYVFGAAGPWAFDCSGLVMAAYARIGVRLPHQSEADAGRGRRVPASQMRPGDLLLYPGHVALYVGGGRMVEAANPRAGVRVTGVRPPSQVRRLL